MKHKVYAIQDAIAGAFQLPFTTVNEPTAIRMAANAVNQEGTLINLNPSDFRLFNLGEFDDQSGKIEALDIPQHVCDMHELKQGAE